MTNISKEASALLIDAGIPALYCSEQVFDSILDREYNGTPHPVFTFEDLLNILSKKKENVTITFSLDESNIWHNHCTIQEGNSIHNYHGIEGAKDLLGVMYDAVLWAVDNKALNL